MSLIFGSARAGAALPVTFEENRGQVSAEVAFFSRTAAYRVFLTSHGAVISLPDRQVVRIGLANARNITPVGRHRLLAKTNYFLGPDPATWRTGIANYEGVTYPQAYPGIDVVWHSRGDEIEHDFLVAAAADPRLIRLHFSGAALRLTPEGDLMAGTLRFHKPNAYQNGREIACRYEVHGRNVRFALGAYNRSEPLLIDPVMSFSTFLGNGTPVATALDGAGNLFVVGTTAALGFPGTDGTFQPNPFGDSCIFVEPFSPPTGGPCTDVFIEKLSGDGGTLLYATYLGGPRDDTATAIAVGPAGNLYIAGTDASVYGFPKMRPLPEQGFSGFFVAELSSDGASLLYATALPVKATAIAVDAAGAVYLTGVTSGGLPTLNAFQPAPPDAEFYKTSDHGLHWQAFMNGLQQGPFTMVAADPINPQVLYVGGTPAGRLLKTSDGGATWTSIANGIQGGPTSIVIDPSSPQTLYLSVSNGSGTYLPGVYKSTDGGTSWIASGSGLNTGAFTDVLSLTLDPTNRQVLYAGTVIGIFKSSDGAATWKQVLTATPGSVSAVGQVVVDPTNSATVYAATGYGVMKSTDGGSTWNPMTNGFAPTPAVLGLAMDPFNPQTLYAGTYGGGAIYKTVDGGATWTRATGLPQSASVQFLLVDPALNSRIWAATNIGVFMSLDAGASWTRTTVPHVSVPALAMDAAGGVYATSQWGPLGDGFAMKLDPTGSNLVYSTYLGGMGRDVPGGIAVDAMGRAYISGETDSADFPLAAPLQAGFGGNSDIFVTVLDPDGGHLAWSTFLGGSGAEGASAIALDAAGDVHLAGITSPTQAFLAAFADANLDPTADAFAAKIKGDGSAVVYSAHLGGSHFDSAHSVAADAAGNTYIAGTTYSNDLPTLNAVQPTLAGLADLLVAKLNGQSGAVEYATYLGGRLNDFGRGIAADAAGNAYVVSQTSSPDFPLQNPWRSSFGSIAVSKILAPGARPQMTKLANAASYTATVAPGELVSLFGTALAGGRSSATQPPLPTRLMDAQVTVNGLTAPLLYASPEQINAQLPFETSIGTGQVQVKSSGGTATITVQVAEVAPAIFTLNQQGTGAGAIEHAATYQLVTDSNPAAGGEFISIYCTGLGAVNPPAKTGAAPPDPPPQIVVPVQVFIGGVKAQVLYAGVAPGFPGLNQVNAQVPAATPSGDQPLQIIQNGFASNTVTVAIQ